MKSAPTIRDVADHLPPLPVGMTITTPPDVATSIDFWIGVRRAFRVQLQMGLIHRMRDAVPRIVESDDWKDVVLEALRMWGTGR